jgi:prophage maintenance system killer protein
MAKQSSIWPKNNVLLTEKEFAAGYDELRLVFNFETMYPAYNQLSVEQEGKLISALSSVNYGIIHNKYRPGSEAAALYLFFIAKEHFILNGNKRAAVAGLFTYLKINNKYLKITTEKGEIWEPIYDLAESAAKSTYRDRGKILKRIKQFIDKHLVNYSDPTRIEISTSAKMWLKNHEGGYSS